MVRLDGDRVVLRLDAEPGAEVVLLPLAGEEPTVAVSPARALALLDGLQDIRDQLWDLAREQERVKALRQATQLLAEPQLAGWIGLSPTFRPGRPTAVEVRFTGREGVSRIEEYAAAVGVPVETTAAGEVFDQVSVDLGAVVLVASVRREPAGADPDGES